MTTGNRPPTRILVVDDDETVCKVLARSLAPLGYAVDIALDANAALEEMHRHAATVALVDIRMPGRDGVWLIEQLQRDYPETAIIIVTGIRNLDPRVTLRSGIVGYLTKPFRQAKMRDLVEKAVAAVQALPPGEPIRGLLEPISDDELSELIDIDEDGGK